MHVPISANMPNTPPSLAQDNMNTDSELPESRERLGPLHPPASSAGPRSGPPRPRRRTHDVNATRPTHDATPVTDYLDSDVLLVNQTANTLQNLCLDFATLGDLKLVERPTVYTIAPHSFQSIKATIKVRTTCK